MSKFLSILQSPAIISLMLVFPFVILELVNRRNYHEGFPVTLFFLMWLLPVVFQLILLPAVREIQTGDRIQSQPVLLILGIGFQAFIASIWVGIVIDQLPCSSGVPLCD